jgi:colicin import membrane protein
MRAKNGVGLGVLALLFLLGSGMGRIVGQEDPKRAERQKGADLAQELEQARAELQKARQEAQEQRQIAAKERDRAEQALQEARRQADLAQQAAAEARAKAEAALRDAERALIQAKQEQADRAQAEHARYLALLAQAEKERAQKAAKGKGVKAPDVKAALAELDKEKATILQKFEQARADLATQLHVLEAQQKQDLAVVEARRAELLGQAKEKPPKTAGATNGSGKLDQILERLDAIEKRLDRIEQAKPQGKPKPRNPE